MKQRFVYAITVLLTIGMGLLSRRLSFLPLWTGDLLYAVMCYLGFRFLFAGRSLIFSLVVALIFCFTIEILQLSQHLFLVYLRHTMAGKLVLGQGFLWTDLLAYSAGVLLIYVADRAAQNRFSTPIS